MERSLLKRILDNSHLFSEQEILDTGYLFTEEIRKHMEAKHPKEYAFGLQTLEAMKQRLEKHNL